MAINIIIAAGRFIGSMPFEWIPRMIK